VKAQNEPTGYKNAAETENGEFDISSDDAVDELTVEKRAKRRRLHRNHTADPKELLSQLCSVATEPMSGYSFSAMIISYFNDYRNYIVSTTTEANIVEKGTSRRGRKRKEVLPSPEVETTDHMQDSYWSGLSLHNHPIHDLRKDGPSTRPRRRRRSSRHTYVPLSELGDSVPKKQIQVMERSIIHVDEKMVDELKPTALVLSFGRSASIPSELDLIKMFRRYGPLKEAETEVDKDTNTVKVVFKKRIDAERAFGVAGKYGTFGPSLRSYRLVNMPFSLKTLSTNNPVKHPEGHGTEIPGSSTSETPKDDMEVDQVHKTEEAEVAGELSVEQAETVKQTSLVESSDATFTNQVVDERTGKMDTELIGHFNQIGTEAHVASVPEGSSEQVGNAEQAYTQESAQDVSEDMQMDVVAEAPKQDHISGDSTVFEAITEAPGAAEVREFGTANEVPEERMVPPVLQSQTSCENVEQDATEQKVGSEVPKLEAETFAAEPVVPSTIEQEVEVESKTTAEVSGEQVYSIEQTVQVEAVTEASGEQLEVGRQTPEDESMADATTEHSTIMVEETVEANTVAVKENIENNNVSAIGVAEEIGEGEIEEASVEKGEIENKAAAETQAGETREGEITVEAPDGKAENETIAETISGETAEVPLGEARTAEEVIEDVKELGITSAQKPVEDAMVITLDERTTVGKTLEDAKVEQPNEKTTTAETTVDDAMVEPPDTNASEAEKTAESATLQAPDEKGTAAETATLQAPDEKGTAAEKTIEDTTDTTVEAQHVQAGASE